MYSSSKLSAPRGEVGTVDRRLTVPAWVSIVIMRPVTALIRNSASDLQIATTVAKHFCHQSKTRMVCVGGQILGCTLRALEGAGVWGVVGRWVLMMRWSSSMGRWRCGRVDVERLLGLIARRTISFYGTSIRKMLR